DGTEKLLCLQLMHNCVKQVREDGLQHHTECLYSGHVRRAMKSCYVLLWRITRCWNYYERRPVQANRRRRKSHCSNLPAKRLPICAEQLEAPQSRCTHSSLT